MKNHYLLLAAYAIMPIACSQNQIPGPTWRLETEDTHITITVAGNRPAIVELKNNRNGWAWIKESSEMQFPENVQIEKTVYKPNWKYKDATLENPDGTKLTLRFFSTTPKLELESVWEARKGCGPVTNHVTIRNNTGGKLICRYSDIVSANIKVSADRQVTLWRFTRSKLLPFSVYPGEPDANTGVFRYVFETNSNFSANITNEVNNGLPTNHPRLPYEVYDVASKHGLYFGYEWPFGRFVDMTENDPLLINHKAYLWDTGSLTLEKDKLLKIPGWYIGTYVGDVDDGSNRMKRWFWNHKITPTLKNNPDEPLIEYCIPGNEAQLIDFYKKYPIAEWGAELGKIDIDWLDGAGSDWTKADFMKYGFWIPDSIKWPNGMTGGDIVHQNKQKLSLYMCNTFENCYIGTQEGRDKEKAALLWRYDNYHYDYWRSDFDLENKPFDYLSHEGLLEILDYMIEARPGFRYEHCSGAAALKDFSTLQRITVFTTEDGASPLNHRKAFYTNSFMINPVQIKADVGMNLGPNGEAPANAAYPNGGAVNDSPEWVSYILRTGFMGANMATNWGFYTPNQIEGVKKHWSLYKMKQRPILRGINIGDTPADVYHILPIPDGVNWDGMEYFNTSLNKGSILLFKPSGTAAESKIIKLKGLDRKANYTLTFQDRKEQNVKISGEELMDNGIEVKGMKGNFASEIIWIN